MSDGLEFLSLHPFIHMTAQDKVLGTVIGSALGDCIGLYTGENCYQKFKVITDLLVFENSFRSTWLRAHTPSESSL